MTARIFIQAMIDDCKEWRRQHKAAGRRIEAAACAIRQKALEDAMEALTPAVNR